MDPDRKTAVIVALLGLAAVSHAVIFIRLADAPSLLIAAARVAIATVVFAPFMLRSGGLARTSGRDRLFAVLAGAALALHFGTWIGSLARVTIAESALLVSLTPVWVALYRVFWQRLPITKALTAAIALALIGTAVIAADGLRRPSGDPAGLGLAVVGGIAMAAYLVIGNDLRRRLPTVTYVSLCYGSATVFLAVAVAVAGIAVSGYGWSTFAALMALGLVSQVGGHTAYNWTLARLSPVFVGICLLGEPIFGSLLGWFYLGEGIPPGTLFGGGIIITGLALAVRAEARVSER